MNEPRVLVVDDQEPILKDFAALLDAPQRPALDATLDELEASLGGAPVVHAEGPRYRMHYARQGLDALAVCEAALAAGDPFAMVFLDVHMPPGIDGVETAARLWKQQPDLEIVMCTAHATYSWQEILARVPRRDQLVILRKPFEPIEVRQLAACLTDKWQRGRALAQQLADLERRVEREVARRMQLELGAMQKFEALGRLAAGIAHEINTPMQYIQSSLEYLAELPECANEVDGAIADALGGVERVSAIVRSVREYAHASRDGVGAVDLNAQIRMAVELARTQYKHEADVVLELGEVPLVRGYADELGRAILNLIINASHAIAAKRRATATTARGTITVATRATCDRVEIVVRDTGCGIAEEYQGRIFEPFFTTKAIGQGTGQGLAIVRASVVERHGGSIRFESVPGEGTTFIIELPVQAQEAVA